MIINDSQIQGDSSIDDGQMRGVTNDTGSNPVSINSLLLTPERRLVDDIKSVTRKAMVDHGIQMSLGGRSISPITPNNMVDDVEYSRLEMKRQKRNKINALVEELLVEILCRLSSHKTAFICKAVCKRWAALISNPFFISRFIAYKSRKQNSTTTLRVYENGLVPKYDEVRMKMVNDRKPGLVVRLTGYNNTWKGLMIRFNDTKKLSLYSLPRLLNGGLPRRLTVVGACNDLLLYQSHAHNPDYGKLKLYISNVQTRQWLALPHLRLDYRAGPIGLIVDPYYYNSSHTGNEDVTVTVNDAYNACIVVIASTPDLAMGDGATEFRAHILSPKTGGIWRDVVLPFSSRCQLLFHSRGPFYIGRKLYFQCELDETAACLIGFDPYVDSDVIKCSILVEPPDIVSLNALVGVFYDQLYLCDCSHEGSYRIWVLEDYETSKWSLRHSIMGWDWIPRDRCLAKLITQERYFGHQISFHPVTPEVIYMLCRRWIVLCNFSTGTMEVVSKLPKGRTGIFPLDLSFEISLPVWPTPLPTFVHTGFVAS